MLPHWERKPTYSVCRYQTLWFIQHYCGNNQTADPRCCFLKSFDDDTLSAVDVFTNIASLALMRKSSVAVGTHSMCGSLWRASKRSRLQARSLECSTPRRWWRRRRH